MSTILKALRRLEDEKQATADRPLREAVVAAPGEPLPRRHGRALGLALAFGALLALLGGALLLDLPGRWRRAATAPQVAAGPPSSTPEAVAAPAQAPAPTPAPPEAASSPPVAPAAAPAPVAVTSPADAPAPPEAVAKAPAAPQTPAAPVAEVPTPAMAVEEPPAIATPAPPRRATPPRVAKAPKPAAEPEVAPVVVAPSLPRVVVTSTIWHPDPGRRTASVALDGRDAPLELRQGDAVGSLVVREIEPGGVLFQLGDIELRRAVGEQP